jgi:glycosyltransferase involved in cell wall biosynthesis
MDALPGLPKPPAPAPLLSVCVPTYERPVMVSRALRSVIDGNAAAAADVEIVVGNNSPDVSAPVVNELLARWPGPRQHLEHRPTVSAEANFNRCIEQARGTYVVFLHDDDTLANGSLPRVLDALRADGHGVHLFGAIVVDETGAVRRRQEFHARDRLEPAAALQRLLSDSSFVRMPALVVRRELLAAVGMFDPEIGNPSDVDLEVKLFARAGAVCEPITLGHYTVHAGAETTGMFNAATIARQLEIFHRAAATGLLREARLAAARADWFHQFILGGTHRELRAGRVADARRVMALFRLPEVRALGRSRRWLPVRVAFSALSRFPGPVTRRVVTWFGRLGPERLWLR